MASPVTVPPPRRLRPWRRLALCLLLFGLAVGGVAGWWFRTTRPRYVFERGRGALRHDDWDRVDSCVERLEAAGEADRAAFLRGAALVGQRRFAEALRSLNRIRGEAVPRVEAAALSGRCLLELKELHESHRVFSWVLAQTPDHVEAHRGMAAIAYDLGNLTAALHHLEHVARLDPRDGRACRLIGLIYKDMAQDRDAEPAYRQALERDLSAPARREVRRELAECLVRQTRYREARDVLDEEASETEDAGTLAVRAECLWRLGKDGEAARLLDEALADFPRNGPLALLRGQFHLGRRETGAAVRSLEQAVGLAPGDYKARFQLARAYRAAGRPVEAQQQERRAEDLRQAMDELTRLSREAMDRPRDADVRLKLAALCEKIERPELAAMWRRAAQACRARLP